MTTQPPTSSPDRRLRLLRRLGVRRRRVVAAATVLLIGALIALGVTDPFSSPVPSSSVTDNAYPTGTATVTKQSLSSQTPVSATLGYAGNFLVTLPSGTGASALFQAQTAAAADELTVSNAKVALANAKAMAGPQRASTLVAARATVTGDENALASAQTLLAGDERLGCPASSSTTVGSGSPSASPSNPPSGTDSTTTTTTPTGSTGPTGNSSPHLSGRATSATVSGGSTPTTTTTTTTPTGPTTPTRNSSRRLSSRAAGATGSSGTTTTAPPSAPSAATGTVDHTTSTSTTLMGTVDPNGAETTYYFEYGPSANYGLTTSLVYAGLGTSGLSVDTVVSGLSPDESYHYRVVATNALGSSYGQDATFTTNSAPTVTTGPATLVSATSGTLSGSVTPNGNDSSYSFEYGTTPSLGNKTTPVDAGAGTALDAVSTTLTGLTPGTTYYYALQATNAVGSSTGQVATFTTNAAPAATTGPATLVSATAGTLSGSVTPNGTDSSYYFDYGTTSSLGKETAPIDVGAGTSPDAVSMTLSGLTANTVYYYRLAATSALGVTYGQVATFTTNALPVATTGPAATVSPTSETLAGNIAPNGTDTSYYFEYGPTLALGKKTAPVDAGAGMSPDAVSVAVSRLSATTTYYFRIVATSALGTFHGQVATFTTATVPTATTGTATTVSTHAESLTGTVTPNGVDTTYYFEYGTTSSFGEKTAPENAGAGTSPDAVSVTVSRLSATTTYHFRLVANSAFGTSVGVTQFFQVAASSCVAQAQVITTDSQALAQAKDTLRLDELDSAASVISDQEQLTSDEMTAAAAELALSSAEAQQTNAGDTFTALPAVGKILRRGQSVYSLDGNPVSLLYGTIPLYRALYLGEAGPDVTELSENLIALGFERGEVSEVFTSSTEAAVKAWQGSLGESVTGVVALGDVVVEPGPIQVSTVSAAKGQVASGGVAVLSATSTTPVVTIALDAAQQSEVKVGDQVTITLPNNANVPGVVSSVGTVAVSPPAGSSSGGPTITVIVTPTRLAGIGHFDQAPVNVSINNATVNNVLTVPVDSLLALASGGYALEEISPDGVHHLVGVTTGLFDDASGRVQVSGGGLAVGQRVVVPTL